MKQLLRIKRLELVETRARRLLSMKGAAQGQGTQPCGPPAKGAQTWRTCACDDTVLGRDRESIEARPKILDVGRPFLGETVDRRHWPTDLSIQVAFATARQIPVK
jgi:hypothetical protein